MSGPRIWGAVLPQLSSPGLWPTGSSHPCARCGDITAGIALGELCAKCARDVVRKASRIGRLAAIVTTLLVVGYLLLTLRGVAPAWQTLAATVGAGAAVAGYLVTSRLRQ